jgi:hypothetical protein
MVFTKLRDEVRRLLVNGKAKKFIRFSHNGEDATLPSGIRTSSASKNPKRSATWAVLSKVIKGSCNKALQYRRLKIA